MKFIFDLIPVILFFCAYELGKMHAEGAHALAQHYLGGIVSGGVVAIDLAPTLLATAVAILATAIQVVYLLLRRRKVEHMLWLSLAIIVVMGGLTIYFHDEDFIKWKPTILYWALGLVMLVEQIGLKTNLMRKAMEKHITLPDSVWARVSLAWILFFLVLGTLNLFAAFVVFKGDTEAWVKFKIFGAPVLTLVFVIVQNLMLGTQVQKNA
jgi:intracellular septation protein